MKKSEFMEFIKGDYPEGRNLELTPKHYLHRWTEDYFGNKCDKIELICEQTWSFENFEIKSREYEKVIAEISKCVAHARLNDTKEVSKKLKNGMLHIKIKN